VVSHTSCESQGGLIPTTTIVSKHKCSVESSTSVWSFTWDKPYLQRPNVNAIVTPLCCPGLQQLWEVHTVNKGDDPDQVTYNDVGK
jgi:hypothetical protein